MIDRGKKNLLGVRVDAVDMDAATQRILVAAESGAPFASTALAVHGVMTGFTDRVHRYRLNSLDLVTPDGQPVRWGINLLYRCKLPERVYGPTLMAHLLAAAAQRALPVYFYGSSDPVVSRLIEETSRRFPDLLIAGAEPGRFRQISASERDQIVERIAGSGARMVFIGLGCPRQEVFVYELRDRLQIPAIAVGAAFDYHAGLMKEPPEIVQTAGLQWLHRLLQEPRRLWRRYLLLNPAFCAMLGLQLAGVWKPSGKGRAPPQDVRPG
jgi:exopolysaccharide biosynthesis WecB/TagA/CpsF family protein